MENRLNIFLIGFMGSGKSTIAARLGKMLSAEVIEMDKIISDREGRSIPDIFAVCGEEYFRVLETNLLIEIQGKEGAVVSCGGGTPMREQNVAEMKKNGTIVWLSAKPETIYERVKDSHDRPLLENRKNVPAIAELMEARREKYEAAADLAVETDGKTAAEICKEIIQNVLHTTI